MREEKVRRLLPKAFGIPYRQHEWHGVFLPKDPSACRLLDLCVVDRRVVGKSRLKWTTCNLLDSVVTDTTDKTKLQNMLNGAPQNVKNETPFDITTNDEFKLGVGGIIKNIVLSLGLSYSSGITLQLQNKWERKIDKHKQAVKADLLDIVRKNAGYIIHSLHSKEIAVVVGVWVADIGLLDANGKVIFGLSASHGAGAGQVGGSHQGATNVQNLKDRICAAIVLGFKLKNPAVTTVLSEEKDVKRGTIRLELPPDLCNAISDFHSKNTMQSLRELLSELSAWNGELRGVSLDDAFSLMSLRDELGEICSARSLQDPVLSALRPRDFEELASVIQVMKEDEKLMSNLSKIDDALRDCNVEEIDVEVLDLDCEEFILDLD